MKKVLFYISKGIGILLFTTIVIIAAFSFTPIYRFSEAHPFGGDKIYNPYSQLDTSLGWMRANFHTHTKVDKGINECPYYPDVVYDEYMKYGYDIVGFSNHQQLTTHPYDTSQQINLYEHGYNLFKFHKLVFGCEHVRRFDHLIPFLDSHKQFMIDLLNKDGDFIVFNHPDRTNGISPKTFSKLSGYRLIEGDAGFQESDKGRGTKLKYWDEGLSAGRYSHNIIGDDNHNPMKTGRIARRICFINGNSKRYEDIKKILLNGNFYTMRVPDFGNGDTNIKIKENYNLPTINKIGLSGDTIFITLSTNAEYIKVTTQNGITADSSSNCNHLEFKMTEEYPYARFTAKFSNGATLYSNAFARSKNGEIPYIDYPHPINWILTILFNTILVLIIAFALYSIYRIIKRKK